MLFRINTSNQGKFREFHELFKKHGLELTATHIDLREIVSDPLTVVTHKASQMEEGVIVDDTVMDIDGADVGIHIKRFLSHLSDFIGRKTSWVVFLAYKKEDNIYIFKGEVKGTIVSPRGEGGFGFDPVFLPEGSDQTLAEYKPDSLNARALAVEALLQNHPIAIRPVMKEWNGPWQ